MPRVFPFPSTTMTTETSTSTDRERNRILDVLCRLEKTPRKIRPISNREGAWISSPRSLHLWRTTLSQQRFYLSCVWPSYSDSERRNVKIARFTIFFSILPALSRGRNFGSTSIPQILPNLKDRLMSYCLLRLKMVIHRCLTDY